MQRTENKNKAADSSIRSHRARKRLGQLGQKEKCFDIFGKGVKFNIGDGQSTHKTYFGSLLALACIVITATYAFKRYTVMSKYGDTTF